MIVYGKQIFFYILERHKELINELYLAKECDKETFKKINEYHLVIYHTIRALYEDYGSTLPKYLEKQLASFVYSIADYIDDNPSKSDVLQRIIIEDLF